MKLQNPWIGYLDRSYKQIKQSLITRLKNVVPEVTDLSESNLLIIILSMFAGLNEQINFYLDNVSRESFLSTARKFSSVVKLTRILDYRIKSYLPSSVDLYITYVNINNEPIAINQPAIIPSGTIVRTSNGTGFVVLKTVQVNIGESYGIVNTRQQEKLSGINLGLTTNLSNQKFNIIGNYCHNSLELTIDGVNWYLKNTLARSLPIDRHYIVDVNEQKISYVRFGNGVNGMIPPVGKIVLVDYYTTEGAYGNTINEDTITILDSVLVLPSNVSGIKITNNLNPIAGSDIESIEDIRNNAPLTIRTLERAVTPQDYKDLVIQADGVAKANVQYNCGKDLNIYIAPNGGGIATPLLLSDTLAYLETVKMITTRLNIKAAGITPVVAKIQIQPRFRADKIQTKLDAENILSEIFSFDRQTINGRIAISDIYGALESLQRVDTLDITALYTLPYPFPFLHQNPLDWLRETLPNSNSVVRWRLVYTGTTFRLFKDDAFLSNVDVNTLYTDPKNIISFRINPGMYSLSQIWDFTSYPFNKTIQVDDNTVPIIVGNQTTIIEVI